MHYSNFQKICASKRQLSPLRFYHKEQNIYQSPLRQSPYRRAPMSPLRHRNSQQSKSPVKNSTFNQQHFYRSPQIYEEKKLALAQDNGHLKVISAVRTSGKGLFQRLIEENKIGSDKKEFHIDSAHVKENRKQISEFELYEKSERKCDRNIFLNVKQAQSFHRVQSNISFSSNNNNMFNTYMESAIKVENNNNNLNSNILQSFGIQSKHPSSVNKTQQIQRKSEMSNFSQDQGVQHKFKSKSKEKQACKHQKKNIDTEEKYYQKIKPSEENKTKQIQVTESDENIMDLLKKAGEKVCLTEQSTDEKQNVKNSVKEFTFSFNMNPFL